MTVIRDGMWFAAVIACTSLTGFASEPPEAVQGFPEPGVSLAASTGLTRPRTIIFSAKPDEILVHAREWAARGIGGFFMDGVVREWSTDVWSVDGDSWTVGERDATLREVRKATALCDELDLDVFMVVPFHKPFDWFDDVAWNHLIHTFGQFAVFVREAGCTGLALDVEYASNTYRFSWDGYDYDGYSRADLAAKMTERMTAVGAAMFDAFPEMTLVTFPEMMFSPGSLFQVAWIEEAARRNAPGGVHLFLEYTYRTPNIRSIFGQVWAQLELFDRLLDDRAKPYWREQCSVAVGLWPFGYAGQRQATEDMDYKTFRQAFAAAGMTGSRYRWIYSHHRSARLLEGAEKENDFRDFFRVLGEPFTIASASPWLPVARSLRKLQPGDYSKLLDVAPVPYLAVPHGLPWVRTTPVGQCDMAGLPVAWNHALRGFHGENVNLREVFHTQTDWMLIGPFPNENGKAGHDTVYPPEQETRLDAEYQGAAGPVKWLEYRQSDEAATVDLAEIFTPNEEVCAYALCYVQSPREQHVQLRLGSNDSSKLWLGGKLVKDFPYPFVPWQDRDIVAVTLPSGSTPVLIKICNVQQNWGFVFRITDENGQSVPGLTLSLSP